MNPLAAIHDHQLLVAHDQLEANRPVMPCLGMIAIYLARELADATQRCVTLDPEKNASEIRDAQIRRRVIEDLVAGGFGCVKRMINEEMKRRMREAEAEKGRRRVA